MCKRPEEQDVYNKDALSENITNAARSHIKAAHRRQEKYYEVYQGVYANAQEIIIIGTGEDAAIALKKKS